MISQKTVLAIIPARGGSKRVTKKNIRPVGGKPLIAWTILEAKKSRYIDRLILSSEDPEIISVARQWECEVPFVRPKELALDDTPGIEPVLHALNSLPGRYDYVVLLQPTSPLRLVKDIDACLETCIRMNAPSCVAVTELEKSPYWMFTINASGRMKPLLNPDMENLCGQNIQRVYVLNGAIYVAQSEWLISKKSFLSKDTVAYTMPKERSIDIDTEMDFLITKCYVEGIK
jgi:CMP-N,N'-diacetyllegionaminic acid synthase